MKRLGFFMACTLGGFLLVTWAWGSSTWSMGGGVLLGVFCWQLTFDLVT